MVLAANYAVEVAVSFTVRNMGDCDVRIKETLGSSGGSDVATIPPSLHPVRVRLSLQGGYREGADPSITRPMYLTAECDGEANSECDYTITDLVLN